MRDLTFVHPDGDFHYIDWGGDGPDAYIAHATGFCARIYTPLAERLSPHLHLWGMDDRGHGLTSVSADPDRLRDWMIFTRDMERFLEHLGHPVVVMGHSRGGVASLMLAVLRPDIVKALVLIDPTILPYSWMWWWRLAKTTGFAKYVPIAARSARRRYLWPDRQTVYRSFRTKSAFKDWTPGFLEGYVTDGLQETVDGKFRLSCHPDWEARVFATCSHDIWWYVPRATQPTLVLYGKKSDTFLPAAVKRYRRLAPHATMVGLDATHFVVMEKPDESAEAILGFLRANEIVE